MKRNGNSTGNAPILILIVVLVLGGIGFLVFKSTKVNPSPTSTPVPNQINNPAVGLKTYSNEKLGFSIKLYQDLDILNEDQTTVDFATVPPMTEPALSVTSKITNFDSTPICPKDVQNTPCIISEYFDHNKKGIETIILDNLPAIKFYIWRAVGKQELIIQPTHKPKLEIRTSFSYNEIHDQILSTFRFIE